MNLVRTITKEDAKDLLAKNMTRPQINKVLHVHPSPMYWKEPHGPIDLSQLIRGAPQRRKINFYMGIPYCIPTDPPHCGFCLFPTVNYKGTDALSSYIEHLEMESKLYNDIGFYEGASLESIYVGGGTPNLMQPEAYQKILTIAHKLFPKMSHDIEKTLEGIPQLFNENKIKAMRAAGFNRVSMGVQQMNEKLIKFSGRKQTRKHVFDAIDLFHKYGLACNVDLIFGWPEQTVDDMLTGLREIVDSGIRHITHYELNIGGRSDFATARRDLIADVPTKIEMYRKAKEFLLSLGFVQKTVYDWELPVARGAFEFKGAEQYSYESNMREILRRDDDMSLYGNCMGAIGYAGVNIHVCDPTASAIGGVSMMNHKSLARYFEDVQQGRFPVERKFVYQLEDLKLTWIFQSSQEMKIDKIQYKNIFGNCLYEEFKNIWNLLEDKNWIRNESDVIRFVGDGEFYIPTIQAILNKRRLEEISAGSRNKVQ